MFKLKIPNEKHEINTDIGVMLININGIFCVHVKETYEEIKSKIKAVGDVIE